ncbi:PREDICTED: alpha-soluble NSF attachment protein [Nipponia nippon]|nr:PREDICTED: alpha-soluble NSF attachment protein [Nipponia nippon]
MGKAVGNQQALWLPSRLGFSEFKGRFAKRRDPSGCLKRPRAIVSPAHVKSGCRNPPDAYCPFSPVIGRRSAASRGSSRIEEACDIYARAANMFKMAKNWSAAGNAFCQAAQLHLQLQSKHDAATNFVDAGNAFKKADPQEAINCLIRAIEIYTDMGRFTIAAKHHISIAEIYETELVDIEKAIAHYEQAADYYKGEESNSSANKCLLKVATYAAQLEQYQKAVEIYEQVGTSAMDSPLLKYSAKEYFFKAALCHFCIDMLNAKLAVQKYEEMFPAFTDSRECKLVKKLLDAHEEQNIDAYTDAVKEYDSISRLDQWLTTMLLRIKKTIQGEEDLR